MSEEPVASPRAAPVWRNERRRIGDLVEWDKNPRRLTEKQAVDLGVSLRKFGYVDPIVLNADGRSIIGGHQRRRLMMLLELAGPDGVVDVRVPDRQLDDDDFAELALRLNRNTGEWDFDALANSFDNEWLLKIGFDERDFGMPGGPLTEPNVASHGT